MEEYTCEFHQKTHVGIKRPEFSKTLYEFLLNASMRDAYNFYKLLKIGCDCPENYKAFDALKNVVIKEIV